MNDKETNEKPLKAVRGTSNLLFSARDVAEALELPYGWVLKASKDGTLPCLKVGAHRRLFNLDAVVAKIAELAAAGGSIPDDVA